VKFILFFLMLFTTLAATEEVSVQLTWKHQFQFAGFYVAKEMGYYKDVGLDVEIKEYVSGMDVVEDVLDKKATYGVGKSPLLVARSKNKPVVMLGAIFQHSPSVLITTNQTILEPSDLAYKKLMITANELQSAPITTILLSHGVSVDMLEIIPHSFDYTDLVNKKVDAMACYISNEPYYLEKSKTPYKIFNPKEYGFDFYGDILFTSEDEIKNNEERVRLFYKATRKAWIYAFNNIEKTAKLIFEKYNTQNKSLESLIYEGKVLKKLAFVKNIPFGHLSKTKLKEITRIYQLVGVLGTKYPVDNFIDPLNLNKEEVKIGVLSKRGDEITLQRWKAFSQYLNKKLEIYDFTIVSLSFDSIEESVAQQKVDFLITNPLNYVQFEKKYGISRVATLLSQGKNSKSVLDRFGGVIFTKADNNKINSLNDLKGLSFGAVNKNSLGGWAAGYELLKDNDIQKRDIELEYFNTHDNVVKNVFEKKVDVGIVRTDTLERMQKEGSIQLSDFKIINKLTYEDFPYLVSTKLYPEWPFSKLKHTNEYLSKRVVSVLLGIDIIENSQISKVGTWTVPLDYSSIHTLLKKLKISPYDTLDIDVFDIFEKYKYEMYILSFIILFLVFKVLYNFRVSHYQNAYNAQLKADVAERTKELKEANERLEVFANKDSLTGIFNRGYFENAARKYFDMAKRNKTQLEMLTIDLDYFKTINDTYGHKAGDEVLKKFTKVVSKYLRASDIFGRIGGEEFSIVLQNTSLDGAVLFAKRICKAVEDMEVIYEDKIIKTTISVGIASLSPEHDLTQLMLESDKALYKAKEEGRNRVCVI